MAKLVIRARLKIGCPSGHLGSSPSPGIRLSPAASLALETGVPALPGDQLDCRAMVSTHAHTDAGEHGSLDGWPAGVRMSNEELLELGAAGIRDVGEALEARGLYP